MRFLQQSPATILLIVINTITFFYLRHVIGTFDDPVWIQGLLFRGAEFAPLTLDKEWYRLFTHMFMHGNPIHLLFNMYALFVVGAEIEQKKGTVRLLWIYFLSGFAASLASLYFNLFVVGVGASGAIFGLFGFSLVMQLNEHRDNRSSITSIIINFALFLGINIFFANALNGDNAAHIGGLLGGLLLGLSSLRFDSFSWVRVEYLFLFLFLAIFLALPRFQVTYFNFFQKILSIEKEAEETFKKNLKDSELKEAFQYQYALWDTTANRLNTLEDVPQALHEDTSRLRMYIFLRKEEARYRVAMMEEETFRYVDSIEWVQERMEVSQQLNYPLTMLLPIKTEKPDSVPKSHLTWVKQWYDEDWAEIDGEDGAFYRIGQKDTLGRWQGRVRDYYRNDAIQMKGAYLDNQEHGIFLYYSDHHTYTSAGRYEKGRSVGKWEVFHQNGKLKSEEFFNDEYFLKNLWDSLGNPIITEGEGTYYEYHQDGKVALKGEFKNGKREGLWVGFHADGATYFEEFYSMGRMLNGRSQTKDGKKYLYDASSLFPMPEGGNEPLVVYLREKVRALNPSIHGVVKLDFRVSIDQTLSDFVVKQSLNPELDAKAIEFIETGPQWIPAHEHGHRPRNGRGRVSVEF